MADGLLPTVVRQAGAISLLLSFSVGAMGTLVGAGLPKVRFRELEDTCLRRKLVAEPRAVCRAARRGWVRRNRSSQLVDELRDFLGQLNAQHRVDSYRQRQVCGGQVIELSERGDKL